MVVVDLKAMLNRLNRYCTRSLEGAAGRCVSRGNYEVALEDLLLTFLDEPSYDIPLILRHFGCDESDLRRVLQSTVEQAQTGNTRRPAFSPLLLECIQDAWLLTSVEMNLAEIRSGMLMLALLTNPRRYLVDAGYEAVEAVSIEALRRDFFAITAGSPEESAPASPGGPKASEPGGPRDDSALGRFAINFTGKARAGEIDPVFCRDREIRQIIDILGRRRKNNPIAVGEAGVGKTAVVEGLALKIVQGAVPDSLKNVDVYGLDLGLLQAGAGLRGEFENRLKGVISEVKSSTRPIILFIDEAHTLIGAGASAGGGDAANLLKPELARGELRTIAATTWSEYKKYFEKDAALARRFQLVHLEEPSVDDAVIILRGLRDTYESAHGVYIRDDAIEAAAALSARYLAGRQLPDKAVDLLDTASARVKISLSATPDTIDDCERRIQTLERERAALQRDLDTTIRGEPDRIADLDATIDAAGKERQTLEARWHHERDAVAEVMTLRHQLAQKVASSNELSDANESAVDTDLVPLRQKLVAAMTELETLQGTEPLIHFQVTPEVVGSVVSDWTGIPVGNMVRDEAQALLHIEDDLKKRIKGQDHALGVMARHIRAAKAGIGNPNTPMGVFLLVGPSGVGKTECALGLAELLFGGERFMVTINMSEFQEKHTVSRLIGSPPGYVGFGEGGVLTEAVRQRPYSVVLLDEVEKADPEVLNLFYQVFDKGMLADGEGRVIDFKNTVICLTSNLASDVITQMCANGAEPEPENLASAIRPFLSAHFKPALLARMEVAPFYPIAPETMRDIVVIKLGRLAARLQQSQNLALVYEESVVDQIVSRCTEVETGARHIDHIMQGSLLPEISTQILLTMGAETVPHTLEVGVDATGRFTYQILSKQEAPL